MITLVLSKEINQVNWCDVEANFTPQTTYEQINKGHGRTLKA
jgi:hypothetical protein